MKWRLGEAFGLLAPKTLSARPPRPRDGDVYSEPCPCGRGSIEYEYFKDSWLSLHSVWDGGKDFGRLSFAPCCKACERSGVDRR